MLTAEHCAERGALPRPGAGEPVPGAHPRAGRGRRWGHTCRASEGVSRSQGKDDAVGQPFLKVSEP